MKITFSGYPRNETLTNFPILVRLSTNLTGFLYEEFESPFGFDLRFSHEDQSTELNYEFEEWDTNGTSYIWVQVDELVDSSTCIFAFWKNEDATNRQVYTTNGATWSAGSFEGVWHLTETGTDLRDDATSNQNDAVRDGSSGVITAAVGVVFLGNHYPNSNSRYLRVTDNDSVDLVGPFTLSAWIHRTGGTIQHGIIEKYDYVSAVNNAGYALRVTNGDVILFGTLSNGFDLVTGSATIAPGQWYHIAGVFDGSTQYIYVNGELDASLGTTYPNFASGASFKIGARGDDAAFKFGGFIDESRIASSARSSNWVYAAYLCTASNDVFNTYGPVLDSFSVSDITVSSDDAILSVSVIAGRTYSIIAADNGGKEKVVLFTTNIGAGTSFTYTDLGVIADSSVTDRAYQVTCEDGSGGVSTNSEVWALTKQARESNRWHAITYPFLSSDTRLSGDLGVALADGLTPGGNEVTSPNMWFYDSDAPGWSMADGPKHAMDRRRDGRHARLEPRGDWGRRVDKESERTWRHSRLCRAGAQQRARHDNDE
jgi:hypothetical protein